jgi:DUF1680 family protein
MSAPPAVTAYFMCPNQLIARKAYRTHYPARLYIECCQSNAPRTLPILVEQMVLATLDDGLAVAFYGSSEAKARLKRGGEEILTQETAYPFEEEILIAVQANPVALEVEVRRVADWNLLDDERNKASGPRLPERPFSVGRTAERLRLVPYGFTTLRMTYLPHVA